MTVFYAYLLNNNDENTWRHVLVFRNSSVADEWWRAISANTRFASVKRLSPDVYNHNDSVYNLYNFFSDGNADVKAIAAKFVGQMYFTLLNDRAGRGTDIIPQQDVSDNISGNWFYIRSKSDPRRYWFSPAADGNYCKYCQSSSCDKIHVSTAERTRFRVTGRDLQEGTVMIGTDQVTLSVSDSLNISSNTVSPTLIVGSNWTAFEFKELRNGFRLKLEITSDAKGSSVEDIVRAIDKSGETWELV